jgi:hypothetical protein
VTSHLNCTLLYFRYEQRLTSLPRETRVAGGLGRVRCRATGRSSRVELRLRTPNSLEGNEYEAIYLESRRTQSAAWPFRVTASLSFAVFARKPRRSRRSIRSGGGIPHSVPFANSESVVKSPRCKSFLAHEVNITDAPTETDFDAI